MKTIQLKNTSGLTIFTYHKEDNTIKDTVVEAIKQGNSLRGADLSFAYLKGADLRDVDLTGADLFKADLSFANLKGADLKGADLFKANLNGADLRQADLNHANLSYADLRGVDLRGVDLSGAYLYGADLRGVDLRGVDLNQANLKYVDLRGVDLTGADLSQANLRYADLNGTIFTHSKPVLLTCKWDIRIENKDIIRIGCKCKSIKEWDIWFKGNETYTTPRDTDKFRLIQNNYVNVRDFIFLRKP